MSEYSQLKQEISELREEVKLGFEDLQKWKSSVDVGMKGDDDHDIWGYKQKIVYNRNSIKDNSDRISQVRDKVNRIYWTAIGAAAVAGTASAIIFNLVQTILTN